MILDAPAGWNVLQLVVHGGGCLLLPVAGSSALFVHFIVRQEDSTEWKHLKCRVHIVFPSSLHLVVVEIWVDNITCSSRADQAISLPILHTYLLIHHLLVKRVTGLHGYSWFELDGEVNVMVLLRCSHLSSKISPVLVVKDKICEVLHVVIVNPLAVDGKHVNLRLSDVEPSVS